METMAPEAPMNFRNSLRVKSLIARILQASRRSYIFCGGPLALTSRRSLTTAGLRCVPGAGRLFQAVGVERGRGRPVREQADDADILGEYVDGA